VSIVVDIIQTISIAIASAGVVAGIVYYAFQVRHQTKIRQTDLIMRLHSQACSKEFVEAYQKISNLKFNDYNDFVEKYGSLYAEGPEQTAIIMCAMFMEGIGVLLHRKLVDIEAIQELFPIESGWRKLEPILAGTRKQQGRSGVYEWFEYLYNEVKNREKKLQQSKT
jgi:hypothetical protein